MKSSECDTNGRSPLLGSTPAGSSDLRTYSVSPQTNVPHFRPELYRARWWILLVFSLTSLFQQMMWNTWQPLLDSVLIAYDWSISSMALLAIVSNGFGTVGCVPLMYFLERNDLRFGMVITVAVMVLGTALWNLALGTGQSWLLAVASLSVGASGCITMSATPLMSVLWFSVSQRNTVTASALAAGNFGGALGFITGPLISRAHITPEDIKHKADLTAEYVSNVRTGLQNLVYCESAAVLLCFIMVLVYFPPKPPRPPSRSQTMLREEFWIGLKHLLKNSQFWILNFACNIPIGSFNSWIQLISVNFRSFEIGEETAGWIGFYSAIGSCFGAIVMSIIADRLKRKTRVILIWTSVCSIVFYAVLVCIQERYIPVSKHQIKAVLYFLCIAMNICQNGVLPLYYELGCEIAYPAYEGLSAAFITAMNCLFAMLYYVMLLIPSVSHNPRWMTWTCFGACVLSLPLLIVIKDRFHRLDIETVDSDDESEADGVHLET